jgi:hypothetical protein
VDSATFTTAEKVFVIILLNKELEDVRDDVRAHQANGSDASAKFGTQRCYEIEAILEKMIR